jgi:hypothetical protein
MPATKRTGLAVLICAGMLCAGTAMAQTAGENAVQAAMDACEQEKEMTDARMHCQLHVLAMQQSMKSAMEGLEGMIHFDFNDANDTDAQKAAKQAMYDAMDECEPTGSKAGMAEECRLEAFNAYQEAMAK